MKRCQISTIVLAAVCFVGACAQQRLTSEEKEHARHVIHAWLECEECEEGELKAVAELGELAVPSLIASLEGGPSPASREKQRLHLIESYRQIIEYGQSHPEARIDVTEEEYVRLYMSNYEALYQSRSAIGLAEIGGDEAYEALRRFDARDLREDVRTSVSQALGKFGQRDDRD